MQKVRVIKLRLSQNLFPVETDIAQCHLRGESVKKTVCTNGKQNA